MLLGNLNGQRYESLIKQSLSQSLAPRNQAMQPNELHEGELPAKQHQSLR